MSQAMRQVDAARYLARRPSSERMVVVSQVRGALDEANFPTGTQFVFWDSSVAATSTLDRILTRAKRSMRSGSRLGFHLERALRSAEWRFRYLDRLVTVARSRRVGEFRLVNQEMLARLDEALGGVQPDRIVVFDLFDLPTVLSRSEFRDNTVVR